MSNKIVEAIDSINSKIDSLQKDVEVKVSSISERLEKAEQVQLPHGEPGAVFGIQKGSETVNSSRPFLLGRLAVALAKRASNHSDWDEDAKNEISLCRRVAKAYAQHSGFGGEFMVPLSSALMPTQDMKMADGDVRPGFSSELVKECRDVAQGWGNGFDPREYDRIAKDLTANNASTGGTFVAPAAQGELIEQLRAVSVFGNLRGVANLPLPAQGKITFPRESSSVTIAAYTEAATISESTPGTGSVSLEAKAYSGLTDITEEFMRFNTSVAAEAFLRMVFAREISLKADRDMINGAGGTGILGLINYSAVRSIAATTTAANGDTLEAEDPQRLYADIADQDAPVDSGFFYAMTNTLWSGLTTRQDSQGSPMFQTMWQAAGGGATTKLLYGNQVVTTTQVPTDRVKGASSDLTLLLAGVAGELMIGRAGGVELTVTNSDASKFQSRVSTMRGTQFVDMAPMHEESFGYIDDLNNS